MDNERLKEKIFDELKELIDKAQQFEDDRDMYCEFMKGMILNTYSVN